MMKSGPMTSRLIFLKITKENSEENWDKMLSDGMLKRKNLTTWLKTKSKTWKETERNKLMSWTESILTKQILWSINSMKSKEKLRTKTENLMNLSINMRCWSTNFKRFSVKELLKRTWTLKSQDGFQKLWLLRTCSMSSLRTKSFNIVHDIEKS